MQEILIIILSFTAFCVSIYTLLKLGNYTQGYRYKQYLNPFVALLYALSGMYGYYEYPHYIDAVLRYLPPNIATYIQPYRELVYSFTLINVFLIFKLFESGVSQLFINKKKKAKVPSFSFAYTSDKSKNIVLRRNWVFPRLYFNYLRWVAVGIFFLQFILLFLKTKYGINTIDLPFFSALAVLIILESYWYLEHSAVEKEEKIAEVIPPDDIEKNYLALWEEYQKVWKDKLLLAWHYQSQNYEPHTAMTINIVEAQNLINTGHRLSVDDYHIIDQLTRRTDILVDDLIIDNFAPVLFTVFLRRLMDGENILVLTPKRSYEGSQYHKIVVQWIKEWFFKLTGNREFWKVELFSREQDVELKARIIISSADDILEKNIIHNHWFKNLKTVLILSGSEVFNQALSSNNILINIIKNKYDKTHLQNIVLSDYCEALQDSVERNLNVNQNLSEQRQRRIPPKYSYTLFWKLEGEELFQQKVLTGYISKYLGAEAVLALLPRREKIRYIKLVGQENLPYTEYLEELDNSQSSLKAAPVAPRMLKKKAVQDINISEVTYLTEQSEDTFILARDTDFNAPATLKKWESYADQHAFIHIISPTYLLREYFIDNATYFCQTPLYPLATKMMISRFGVARRLLERMIAQEITEKEIFEELYWINPNVIYVKQELKQLFRLAFNLSIDNYLEIQSAYEFDKSKNRFEKITKYRLLTSIKDTVNLNFLKDITIQDRANNVLKIMDIDLLFQNYLPDQIHAFNGKPYKIRGFDRLSYKLVTDYASADSHLYYRNDLSVTLYIDKLEKSLTESHKKQFDDRISITIHEGAFDILTNGYFTFKRGLSLQNHDYTYTSLPEAAVSLRHYSLGRLALLTIDAPQNTDIAKVTATLSILLNEIMLTLFPQNHQYLIIGAPVNDLVFKEQYLKLYPSIKVDTFAPDIQDDFVQLFIIEDSHQDLGLVQSLFDKWDYVFRITDDYLTWLIAPDSSNHQNTKEKEDFRKSKLDKMAFLKYGSDKLPEFIDIKGTSKLLRSLLGRNPITLQRQKGNRKAAKK